MAGKVGQAMMIVSGAALFTITGTGGKIRDRWIVDALVAAVDQYRHEVGHLIEDTVGRWDPDVTSRKIELATWWRMKPDSSS